MNEKPPLIKTIHFLLISIVFTIPLFFTRQLVFPFTQGKTFLFYVLIEIVFVLWLYAVIKQKEYLPPKHPILIAGGIFLLLYTISGIFGVSPETSFWSSMFRMSGLVFLYHLGALTLVLASTVRDRKTWDKILTALVGAGVVVVLINYLSRFGFNIIPIDSGQGSLIGNSSFAGAYLLFAFFSALILFHKAKRNKKIILGAAVVSIFFSPILFNLGGVGQIFREPFGIFGYARAATTSLWIGLLVYGLIFLSASSKKYIRYGGRIGLTFLITIVTVFVIIMVFPNSPAHSLLQDKNIEPRFVFWESAIEGIKERPILGWGPENYFAPFFKYFDPLLLTEEYGGGADSNSDKPHNTYLEVAVTGGIVGLLSYLAIFYFVFFSILKAYRDNKIPLAHAGALSALLVGYLLQKSFFFDTITSYIAIALIFGYVVWFSSKKKGSSYPKIKKHTHWRGLAMVLPIFFLIFYTFTYKPYIQQTTLLHIMENVTVMERGRAYEKLFAQTSHARTSMMIYTINKMTGAVPEILPTLISEKREFVFEDAHSLRKEAEKYIGDNPAHYRTVLSFIQLLHLEYILQTDTEKQQEILDIAEKYESYLFALSPNNPRSDWAQEQQKLFRARH